MPQNYSSLKNVVGAAWYNTTTTQTGFLPLPVGTTAQRPVGPSNGITRFNSTLNRMEYYDSSTVSWMSLNSTPSGTTITVEFLLLAGGGGGGTHQAGGGGAGGLLYYGSETPKTPNGSSQEINLNSWIGVTVGAGGAGANSISAKGTSGSNSIFSSFTSTGGGGAVICLASANRTNS